MRANANAKDDRAAEVVPPIAPRASWRVAAVEALPGFRLRVRFNDGIAGEVEMAELVHSEAAGVFAALRDERVFERVRVELGVVVWPGELDLAPDAMYEAIKRAGRWVLMDPASTRLGNRS